MIGDELDQLRINNVPPAAATEDAVMASAFDFQVLTLVGGHAAAQVLRRTGLARARNIVQLTFHGHQRSGLDVLRPHAFDLAVHTLDIPGAIDQFEVLEHGLYGFQVVIGVHVEDGVVLVVELAVGFRAGVVTLDQVLEIVVMAVGMAIGVHGDETRVLQKARIDPSAGTREVGRHTVDHIVFEPLEAFVGGQVVHRSR